MLTIPVQGRVKLFTFALTGKSGHQQPLFFQVACFASPKAQRRFRGEPPATQVEL
jgi:hypothetical protein